MINKTKNGLKLVENTVLIRRFISLKKKQNKIYYLREKIWIGADWLPSNFNM